MEKLKHWTANSIDDFVFRISSDFVAQLETKMEDVGEDYKSLAKTLDVTPGRVSQILNNPGNLTLKNTVKYARALGMKIAIVAYDDDDPTNNNGPVNSEVFSACWQKAGRPTDVITVRGSASSWPRGAGILAAQNTDSNAFYRRAQPSPISHSADIGNVPPEFRQSATQHVSMMWNLKGGTNAIYSA